MFYCTDQKDWMEAVNHVIAAGYLPVPSFNPYWDRAGRTFEDPDGYRVVFQNGAWTA